MQDGTLGPLGATAIPSRSICSWQALRDSRPSWACGNMTTMMKHPKWKWSCLRWTCAGAVSWQGGEHSLSVSDHGREGQEMWRAQPKAGGEGGPQPPVIRKVPVHSLLPEALPKAAASHGMDLSTFTASLPIAPCLPVPLGSLFGWQLPFPSFCVILPISAPH